MQTTVERSWYQICVDPEGDLYKTIKRLREKVSLSESMEKERVREKYRQALKVKSKMVDPEVWARNLEVAYRDTMKKDISEIQGHLRKINFINTTAYLLPSWLDKILD